MLVEASATAGTFASPSSQGDLCEPVSESAATALEAKRRAIIAAIVAARLAHAEAVLSSCDEQRQQRKVTAEDLFGSSAEGESREEFRQDVKIKEYRMQGEFGAKKFIKP